MSAVAVKKELKEIPLNKITANTGQTRGMGVISQLMALGYGVFEKISVEADKFAIWPMLTSDKPDERKTAATLIREHEPDIVNAAESQEQHDQLQPIRVVELDDGTYDVIFGMTRAFARAFNHAENAKAPDTIEAMVMDKSKIKDVDLKFMGYAENNDRRDESPIDKALFFAEAKNDYKLTPDDIGKKVGLTGQAVRDYLKMLHPKLEDKRMDIHEGKLSIDKAKKLLKKRQDAESGDSDAEPDGASQGNRARMHSVKKLAFAFDAKKKPDWMNQKEWELFIKEDVRKWLAVKLVKKYKPFTGEVLTVEEKPKAKASSNTNAGKGVVLTVPKSLAVKLLTALDKPESEGWTDKQLISKLENIPSVAEVGTKLESEKLQGLLEKLFSGYEKGITVKIK